MFDFKLLTGFVGRKCLISGTISRIWWRFTCSEFNRFFFRVFMIRERLSITSNLEDSIRKIFPSNFASNFCQNFISFWNILALSKHLELYKINDNFTERRRYFFCTKRYLGIKLTSLHWLKFFPCPEIEAYFYLNILHKHLFSSLGRPRATRVFMNGFKANR